MKKRKRKAINNIKRITLLIITLIMLSSISFVIYAATLDYTDIVCKDSNFYKALKNELPSGILSLVTYDENNLTIKIPTEKVNEITYIDLSNNQITNLSGIEKLESLNTLNLSNNEITDISILNNLTNLTSLNLNNNQLGSNISDISNKTNLTELLISNIGISNLDFLSKLTKISTLDISSNNISSLSAIRSLYNITSLNVSENSSLNKIEEFLVYRNLTKLDISETGITSLKIGEDEDEEGIYELTKLEELNVRNIKATDLSPIVKTYTSEDTYETIAYLQKLKKLDVSYIQDGISFYDLQYLTNLTDLYMIGCKIYSITNVAKLTKLNYLNLEENNISDISDFVEWEYDENGDKYISNRLNAKMIILKNNNITDISVFYNMGDIDYLDLSNEEDDSINMNGVYNTSSLEHKTLSKGLNLYNQRIYQTVYRKTANINQYIILPYVFQHCKDSESKVYSSSYEFEITGAKLNQESPYQDIGNYNVIIPPQNDDNTEENEISVTISDEKGGCLAGSKIYYNVSYNSNGVDSLLFNDPKLVEKIYTCLYSKLSEYSYGYLARAYKILNVNQYIISTIYELDLSNAEISDLTGLESFENLSNLNVSDNNITTLDPIKYCTNINTLNVANCKIGQNNTAILNMKSLNILNLSNTGMENINVLNNYANSLDGQENNMTELNISSNGITDISNIEKFNNLTNLNISKNNISCIDNIYNKNNEENKLSKLKTLNISNNNITDISVLKNITTMRTLNVSNNLIKDISTVYRGLTTYNFSNNLVTDISYLSGMTSLTNLIMDNNYIDDVSSVENLQAKNEFSVKQQKLTYQISEDESGTIQIDLPSIFISSQNTKSKIYSSNDLETSNCTIENDKINVNVDDLIANNNIATVKITNGNASSTTFTIANPLKATISYSPDKNSGEYEYTKDDVTASISFNRSNVTILNNNGSNQYKFTENGSFTFIYEDENGFKGEAKVEVTWIDKEPLKLILTEKIKNKENSTTKVILKFNKNNIQVPDGWTLCTEDADLDVTLYPDMNDNIYTYIEKTFDEPGSYSVSVTDKVGNTISVPIEIKSDEDTTPPTITGVENGKTYTEAVTPIIEDENGLKEVILTKDGATVEDYTQGTEINENGNYILSAEDAYGNITEVTFTINIPTEIVVSDVITSDKYSVDETSLMINKVDIKTTIEQFEQETQHEMEYTITKADGSSTNKTDYIATGYIIKMQNGKEYTIIVTGDVNGDGKMTAIDYVKIKNHIMKKTLITSEVAKKAADANNDNKISALDYVRIKNYIMGGK